MSATITSIAGRVDSSSVVVIIPSGMSPLRGPLSLNGANTFQGSIDISSVKSGAAVFEVLADDTNGNRTVVESVYKHDHGPVVEFLEPRVNSTAKGSINVRIHVSDANYPFPDLAGVHVQVQSKEIAMVVEGNMPDLVAGGVITFNDSRFVPALDGLQVINVTATNSTDTVGRATRQFTVDSQGPIIAPVNPVAGQFVGGVIQIRANISDISDIREDSVYAVLGGSILPALSVQLRRDQPDLPIFSGLFDVRSLGTNYVLPSLSFRAKDKFDNSSEVGIEIAIDNVPPAVSIDPPFMRVRQVKQNIYECSRLFDPVGEEVANDGDIVPQIITLRARVEDRGNIAPGLIYERWSGIAPDSVDLFVSPASSEPLVVDTDGDGYCDDINPNLQLNDQVMASNQAVALALKQFKTKGAPNLQLDTITPPAPWDSLCTTLGEPGAQASAQLCALVTPMTLSLTYGSDVQFAIWTVPEVTQAQCTGAQFDSLNRMPEGPACVAVRAVDNVSNNNVSQVIRLCIDRGGGACNTWPPATLPACSVTYNQTTHVTDASTHCIPANRRTLPIPASARCDGVAVGGYCYKYFEVAKTQAQAQTACQTWAGDVLNVGSFGYLAMVRGGHYSSPLNTSKINTILNALGPRDKWIGIANANANPMRWLSREYADDYATNFDPKDGNTCVIMQASNGKWKTVDCTVAQPAYLCQRPYGMFPQEEVPLY